MACIDTPSEGSLAESRLSSVSRGRVCVLMILTILITAASTISAVALVRSFRKRPTEPPSSELKPRSFNESSGLDKLDRTLKDIPDVTVIGKSDERGYLHGTVHNDTSHSLQMLKLSIKTAKWERKFDVRVWVNRNTTERFSLQVGDALLDVQSFDLLDGVAANPFPK